MAYRNKTFVSFASENIDQYRMMCAWRRNHNIDFDFNDAHDLNVALDTSHPDTIRRRLGERLSNTKQVVLLVGDDTRAIASRPARFLHYEVEVIHRLGLPVVFANLNGSRLVQRERLPRLLTEQYTISVSFKMKIIKYALDEFVADYDTSTKATPHYYRDTVYSSLGL